MLHAHCVWWGISTIEQAKEVFDIGFEKIALNSNAYENPNLISVISKNYGSQGVIVSIDYRKTFLEINLYTLFMVQEIVK